jgi:hypothetical protein
MRPITTVILLPLLLFACASEDPTAPYSDINGFRFRVQDEIWRIYDKPASERLMIAPTVGTEMDNEFISDVTLGIADTDIPKSKYQEAVEAWLIYTHRRCSVTNGQRLEGSRWEFKYHCR